MKKVLIGCYFICIIVNIPVSIFSQVSKQERQKNPKAILAAMPQIGSWMFESNGLPATWLGFKMNGKTLYEPVNLIIVDTISTSVDASTSLVGQTFASAGFDARLGHSSDYKGRINNIDFSQLPQPGSAKAFSNYLWSFTNDHARLFGPYQSSGMYFWIGAASREMGISHEYVSFKKAVDELQRCLLQFAQAKKLGNFNLQNTINADTLTTGDHNGFAPVLQITGLKLQAPKSSISVEITGAFNQKYLFSKDIIQRRLMAQNQVDPQKTLGFFTDRNSSSGPFYFSCVIANLAFPAITPGDFPVIPVVNDMPQLVPGTTKGGFISIKIINKNVARPDEYISIADSNNIITIKEITAGNIKGSFSTSMRCISDTIKQIKVNGSFELQEVAGDNNLSP